MSETREQFRDRLGAAIYNARLHYAGPWEIRSDTTKKDYCDAAEAVYAQAVRDMYDFFRRCPPCHHDITIEVFAKKKGIDLSEPAEVS